MGDIIATIQNNPTYQKIFGHPKLQNLQYASLAGSYAYGTATENSDVDIRGWYYPDMSDIIGMNWDVDNKETQVEFTDTDSVFFSFHKFIKLLANCNPNIIELLGTKPEHLIVMTEDAKYLREQQELFLSKRAFITFAGYATQQLRRLENALARDDYPPDEKEKHLLLSLESEMISGTSAFQLFHADNTIKLYLDKSADNTEIYVNLNLQSVPLRQLVAVTNQFSNQLKNYGKLTGRNRKKDDVHLYKHAMHLIRLYYTGIDILRHHQIVTYREKEHDLLMSIRNQQIPLSRVFQLQSQLEVELQNANDNSTLPDYPNYDQINQLVIRFVENHRSKLDRFD